MTQCFNPDCLRKNPENAQFCQYCSHKLQLRLRYRATNILGQGGFGRTFLAVDEDKPSQPTCVIKQFYPQAQGTDTIEKAYQLFAREAEQLDKLGKHPQIPELLAYFTENGQQYLVQEYIDGQNLEQVLATEGKFSERQIQHLLEQILPILDYLHQHQVIHRDIKPANIIRRENGKLILVDFGAVKHLPNSALSVTGTTIGSAGYASPEQIVGKVQPNSDIYSLGATCLHMLTQIEPFDLFDVTENKWVWRDYLDTPLEEPWGKILDKMLVVATKRRYQTASEVLQDLSPKQPLTSPTATAADFSETTQTQQQSPDDSRSIGYDYTRLRDLLANRKWKEADKETANAMLQVSRRQNEGWLRPEDAEIFPSEDLQTIDRLWVKYSNGHFGFSVQQQIYQNLGETDTDNADGEGWKKIGDAVDSLMQKNLPQFEEIYQNFGGDKTTNIQRWERFGDAVGWRDNQQWKNYGELSFILAEKTPRGHLPVANFQIIRHATIQGLAARNIGSIMPLAGKWRKQVEILQLLPFPQTPSSSQATSSPSPQTQPKSASSRKGSQTKEKNSQSKQRVSPLSSLSKLLPVSSSRSEEKLNSAVGYDYTRLRDLLAARQWREADEETANAMLKVACRQKEGWLYPEDIKKFPRKDLQTIDRLWVKYSYGHFGFSVQKEIYQDLGGMEAKDVNIWNRFGETVTQLMQGKLPQGKQSYQSLGSNEKANVKVWEDFGEAVGWQDNGEWKSYEEIYATEFERMPWGNLPISDIQIMRYSGSEEGLVWCYILLWEVKATLFGRKDF